jgi:hypothetical protein
MRLPWVLPGLYMGKVAFFVNPALKRPPRMGFQAENGRRITLPAVVLSAIDSYKRSGIFSYRFFARLKKKEVILPVKL